MQEKAFPNIRRVCRKFNNIVVFNSRQTLHSMLTKVKDTLPLVKQSNVVYRIPYSWSHVYTRKTKWTRLKEHQGACERGWWICRMKQSMRAKNTTWSTGRRWWCWTIAEDRSCWRRRPCTSRWHPQRNTQLRWRTGSPLVAGLLWWGGRKGGAMLTDLWPPMTCLLSKRGGERIWGTLRYIEYKQQFGIWDIFRFLTHSNVPHLFVGGSWT